MTDTQMLIVPSADLNRLVFIAENFARYKKGKSSGVLVSSECKQALDKASRAITDFTSSIGQGKVTPEMVELCRTRLLEMRSRDGRFSVQESVKTVIETLGLEMDGSTHND